MDDVWKVVSISKKLQCLVGVLNASLWQAITPVCARFLYSPNRKYM